jgi:hypothetical protein
MTAVYKAEYEPNPTDARDVLAFVLCPLSVFAPDGDEEELEAVAEMIGPAKEEAVRRWQEADKARKRN